MDYSIFDDYPNPKNGTIVKTSEESFMFLKDTWIKLGNDVKIIQIIPEIYYS